jgi:hypothetical protein
VQRAPLKRLLLVVKVIVVLMNVTFASSRKVAKKVVNVLVEEAASDRELRGLRELRELLRLVIRKCSGTRGVHTDDSVGP